MAFPHFRIRMLCGTIIAACMAVTEPLVAALASLALMGFVAEVAVKNPTVPEFSLQPIRCPFAYARNPASIVFPKWQN